MEHREITIKVCDIHIFQHICSSFILYFCVFERWNAIIGLRTIAILWNQLHPDRYQKLDASSNLNQNYCYWKRIQTVEFPIPWPFNLNSRCLNLLLFFLGLFQMADLTRVDWYKYCSKFRFSTIFMISSL